MKKKLLLIGAVSTIGLSGLIGAGLAGASSQNGSSTLVDKIASTFNLNKDEVQKVFDQDRSEHQAEQKAKYEERLAKAVAAGEIRQDQADGLKAKMDEMQSFRDTLKDKEESDRKEAIKAKMDEMKSWMDANNIPESLRMEGRGGPRHHRADHDDASQME